MTARDESDSLVRIADSEGLVSFLVAAMKHADAIATGAIGTEKLHLFMIPGRLIQAARNRDFLRQLAREVEDLRQKGKIRPEFEKSESTKACLQELLAALEEPPVDETKFKILKAVFLAAASQQGDAASDVTPQLLMNVARQLNSGEILVLASVYRVVTSERDVVHTVGNDASKWVHEIASRSGFGLNALVEMYEDQLARKNLLTPRTFPDRSGIKHDSNFRLTDLGVKLCEYIVAGGGAHQDEPPHSNSDRSGR